ncbi:MAG: 16S rRNA (uracil(1498)-N(3))-methyltransferase [Bacteroidetes bacterium]|nr:16S rRNA (uracil(1498)-N(3))-methyltransferase [Bacteroidota bacterium]
MEYYYAPPSDINENENTVILKDFEFRHLVKVLRKKAGDNISVTDGNKNIYRCTVKEIEKNRLVCSIDKKEYGLFEPDINLTLCIAPLRNTSRFEFAVEKAVELGVNRIIPVITEFTVSKFELSRSRHERLEKIIISAMGQSQRCFKPELGKSAGLKDLSALFSGEKNKVVMYEFSEDMKPYEYNAGSENVVLLIGPEGGFSAKEIEFLRNDNWQIKSLGNRKLRAETAAVVAVNQIISKLK